MKRKQITQTYSDQHCCTPFIHKRVCAYVRVSTDHFAQAQSLENQTEYYKNKLGLNLEYEFCGIFSDAGISGNKENRPGFQAMMTAARDGKIDLIFTKSISRFARNTLMLLESIRELKALGIGVIFEEQQFNTLTAGGELMLTVLASIAEEERRSVCGNVKWAIQNRYKSGNAMINANHLLGYTKNENGDLVIDKEQAKIIRIIFKRYIEGISGYAIANELNAQGIPSYTNFPWSPQRILRIISNEKYVGDCLMQKSYMTFDGKQQPNHGEVTQYYIKNHHPAIISQKNWDNAQKLRTSRKRNEYPFTGLLHCPYCGAKLIRLLRGNGKHCDWICGTYMYHSKSACQGVRIPEETLYLLTANKPLTKPMIVEEIYNGEKDNPTRHEKSYRLVPLAGYTG